MVHQTSSASNSACQNTSEDTEKKEQYFKATPSQLQQDYKDKILSAEAYLLYIIRATRSIGIEWNFTVKEFCQKYSIKERTFYHALSRLKVKNLVGWKTSDKVTVWWGTEQGIPYSSLFKNRSNSDSTKAPQDVAEAPQDVAVQVQDVAEAPQDVAVQVQDVAEEKAETFTTQAFQDYTDIKTNTNKQETNKSTDALSRQTHTQQLLSCVNELTHQEVIQDVLTVKAEVVEESSSKKDRVEVLSVKPIPNEGTHVPVKFKRPERPKKFEPSVEAFIDKYEETKKVHDYGLEFQTWAMDEIGDLAKVYRKSGWILMGGNDIDLGFKKYLATYRKQRQGSNFTIGDADAWIIAMEKDPTKWGQLRDRVREWQGIIQSGNPDFNLAQEMVNCDKLNNKRQRETFDFK